MKDPETLIVGQNLNLILNYIEYNNLNIYPRFIEIYIAILYNSNGIRNYNFDSLPYIVNLCNLSDLIDEDDEYKVEDLVEKFENKLPSKKWFNKTDQKTWEIFQQKRKIVNFIEPFIVDLQLELKEAYIKETDFEQFIQIRKDIYESSIRSVKKMIAEFNLFEVNLEKVSKLENLVTYFEISKSENNKEIKHLFQNQINTEIQMELPDQEKFVYCYKLGIIDYFRNYLKDHKLKAFDVNLYPLISLITGINKGYIKKLMSYANNPESISKNNPFTNKILMDEVNKYLINTGLKGKN
ncbi:MAG: hypothetical protein IPO78_14630 [Saprospiraceae bacterium]|nr:hypothetical protein [Saprospiraceae bacterium]